MFSLSTLLTFLRTLGAQSFYAKRLAPNDNSKNQIYAGGSDEVFGILPPVSINHSSPTAKGPAFKAPLDLWWIADDRTVHNAPGTQLIYYPQYPEVRVSGFLKSCTQAPNDVLTSRDVGRVLVFGVTPNGRILAYACDSDHPVAKELASQHAIESRGVFIDLSGADTGAEHWKQSLLNEICRITRLGWIPGKRLRSDGTTIECTSSNCGGYTLECELGISANGYSLPDYHGWEVKAYTVNSFDSPTGQTITLMTPEPNGGLYADDGPAAFVRKYGYEDLLGRADRINFGGIFRIGVRQDRTGLTMRVEGYDPEADSVTGSDGFIALFDDDDNIAASWSFAGLLDHWRRKHSSAVYVPTLCDNTTVRRYRYGSRVTVANGAYFRRLLRGFASGVVYYDPGIKLTNCSTSRPQIKRRSQFRVRFDNIDSLYVNCEQLDACSCD